MNRSGSDNSVLSNENHPYGIILYQMYLLKHWDCFHFLKPDIYVKHCKFHFYYWFIQAYVRNYGSKPSVILQWCSTCAKWAKYLTSIFELCSVVVACVSIILPFTACLPHFLVYFYYYFLLFKMWVPIHSSHI